MKMELRLDIGINQLIGLIKQLPADQKIRLKKEMDKELTDNLIVEQTNDLTEFLLNGPVMTKDEEQNFKKFNKEFDKWTKTLSV